MLDLLFTGAAATSRTEKLQEMVTANLANAGTPGYKGRIGSFEAVLVSRESATTAAALKPAIGTDFSPGPLVETGSELDFALPDEGFFVVQTEGGTRYTRNGSFTLDSEGQLRTRAGHLVLGDGGPISLDPRRGRLKGTDNGLLFQGEAQIGALRIVKFDDPQKLLRESDSLFASAPGQVEGALAEPQVRQGFQEKSNVDLMQELVGMLTLQRHLDTSHRIVRIIDRTLNSVINSPG
jgi:flagellar basal-body rod protein FlgF